jgi:DNA-damage-inducible protein D
MSNDIVPDSEKIPHSSPFEQAKRTDDEGNEFWSARDLMPILEYEKWHNFKKALLKAQMACENSGHFVEDHFTQAGKMVMIGSDAKREVEYIHLSRYACYLLVQNADPTKEVVAMGQTYFAVQTHRQELADKAERAELSEDQRRLVLREKIKQQNVELASAARGAGVVTPIDFAVFQDHGYRGLYGGLAAKDIHKRKKLKKTQHILDHMGSTELAANWFRNTQAEDKLRQDNIQGKENANQVHHAAGVMVRRFIQEFGGTMPENLPTPDNSIQTVERNEKKRIAPPKKAKTGE